MPKLILYIQSLHMITIIFLKFFFFGGGGNDIMHYKKNKNELKIKLSYENQNLN